MPYLYHRVPKEMEGNVLFPLNRLKETLPAIYEREVRKYEGREQLLEKRIPALDCLWNDVLHLVAVEPGTLNAALRDAGKDFALRFYEIDADSLDRRKMVVYLYKTPAFGDAEVPEDEWEPFDVARLPQYGVLPQQTSDYYRNMIAQGKDPLMFPLVPHIFYRGSINIAGLRIVS